MHFLMTFFLFFSINLFAKDVMTEFKVSDEYDTYLEELNAVKSIDIYRLSLEFDSGDEVFVRVQGKVGEEKFNRVFQKRFVQDKEVIHFNASVAFVSKGGDKCSEIVEISYHLKFSYSRLLKKFNEDQELVVTRKVIEQCLPPYDAVAITDTHQLTVEVSALVTEVNRIEPLIQDITKAFVIADEHSELLTKKNAPKRVEIENITVLYETPYYVYVHLEGAVGKKDIDGIHQFTKRDGRIIKTIYSPKLHSIYNYCGNISEFNYLVSFILVEGLVSDLQLQATYKDLEGKCYSPNKPKQNLNVKKIDL